MLVTDLLEVEGKSNNGTAGCLGDILESPPSPPVSGGTRAQLTCGYPATDVDHDLIVNASTCPMCDQTMVRYHLC